MRCLGPVGDTRLGKDIAHVPSDRVEADEQVKEAPLRRQPYLAACLTTLRAGRLRLGTFESRLHARQKRESPSPI